VPNPVYGILLFSSDVYIDKPLDKSNNEEYSGRKPILAGVNSGPC
jgi:hypothetical protein